MAVSPTKGPFPGLHQHSRRDLASILGHRNTSTTLKYYARWMPNANQQAMDKMDGITGSKKSDDEDEEA